MYGVRKDLPYGVFEMKTIKPKFLAVQTFVVPSELIFAENGEDSLQQGTLYRRKTPITACIFGRFQILKEFHHPNLCQYVDIIKGKRDRLYLISEYFQDCLKNYLMIKDMDLIVKWTSQIADALSYLNQRGVVHMNLSLENCLLTEDGNIKLFNWGLFYMTNNGEQAFFPMGLPLYLSPERIIESRNESGNGTPVFSCKSDVWALGMILLFLYHGENFISKLESGGLESTFNIILSWRKVETYPPPEPRLHSLIENMKGSSEFCHFMWSLLSPFPENRSSIEAIQNNPLIQKSSSHKKLNNVDIPLLCENFDESKRSNHQQYDAFVLPILFHFHQLNGFDPAEDFKKLGKVDTEPPITRIPLLMVMKDNLVTEYQKPIEGHSTAVFDSSIINIDLSYLQEKMLTQHQHKKENILKHASLDSTSPVTLENLTFTPSVAFDEEKSDMKPLPLSTRERDVEYQISRCKLFIDLLATWPERDTQLKQEASIDIPPILRGKVWAALLGIIGDPSPSYEGIDKECELEIDHQLDLDIPRCHQYHDVLANPTGHRKLKRFLKSWIIDGNGLFVYWQGLDSICAPFVVQYFNDEPLGYYSFSAFVRKSIRHFFVSDNSKIIAEYTGVFNRIFVLQDPETFLYLVKIGVTPDLYVIPWFMTLYGHVFHLEKVFRLWDKYLVGPPHMFVFTAVAILTQIRDQILHEDFSHIMSLLSGLPDLDVDRLITDTIKIYQCTPTSVLLPLNRYYEVESTNKDESRYSLWQPLPIDKDELFSRISMKDFLLVRPYALVLDIRPLEEFQKAHEAFSLNFQCSQFSNISTHIRIQTVKTRFTVLIANSEQPEGPEMATLLIRSRFQKVLLLICNYNDINCFPDALEGSRCTCHPSFSNGYNKCINM